MSRCPYGKYRVDIDCLARKCKFVRILYFIDESTPVLTCLLNYSEEEREKVEREALFGAANTLIND